MATAQDMQIFITGVVGRAMGSGKFTAADIAELARNAKLAFVDVLGAPESPAPPPRPPAPPPRPASPTAHPGHVGRTASEVVAQGRSGGNGIPPTGEHTFGQWATFRASFYGFGKESVCETYGKAWCELTWDEFFQMATQGDPEAIKALTKMSEGTVKPGKYEKQDRFRIAHSKCVLNMSRKLREQGGEPDMSEVGTEESPF